MFTESEMRDRLDTFEYELLNDKQKQQIANRESRAVKRDIAYSFGSGAKSSNKSLHRKVKSMQSSNISVNDKDAFSTKTFSQNSSKHSIPGENQND